MDAATRQVGQHMEYEPDWESGFNLHIKLAFCISLLIQWCATDEVVLTKAYRLTLKKLEETPCYEPGEGGVVREIADHTTSCVHYDVASKPVSIHLPLSRFWAGLYAHIEQFNLHTKNEFLVPKPTPVQLIEPVLRAQVLESNSNLWLLGTVTVSVFSCLGDGCAGARRYVAPKWLRTPQHIVLLS